MALPEIIKDIEARVKDTGDIMTGSLDIVSDYYWSQQKYGIHMHNSDIIGANSILFQDLSNGPSESVAFMRDASKNIFDAFWIANGVMYFTPNYTWAASSGYTTYEILHTGNLNAKLDSIYANVTGDTFTGNVNFNSTINNNFRFINNESVTSGTSTGLRNTLLIYGGTYGNDAAYLKTAGKLSYGDPGPQIIFNTANSLTSGQTLALIFTDNDTIGTGVSLSLVGNQENAWFIAPTIKALTKFIGNLEGNATSASTVATKYWADQQLSTSANANLWPTFQGITCTRTDAKPAAGTVLPIFRARYQNSAGNYYDNQIINCIATGNADNTHNLSVAFGSRSGTTYIVAGESGVPVIQALKLYDNEHIYQICDGSVLTYVGCSNDAASYTLAQTITKSSITAHVPLYGAVWNDYAEYRQADSVEPGRCIIEVGDDTLTLSSERLQRGAEIISDTFGFAIGETDDCKTPIAASGRVLAYGYEDREQFKKSIGYPVCSGPGGTVSIMTEDEETKYPSRIIGYVSAVPDYEEWGTGNVKVNGRIWIRVK